MKATEMRKLMNEQKEANRKHKERIQALSDNVDYSKEYKARKIEEMNTAHRKESSDRGKSIASTLKAMYSANEPIDLASPLISNYIQVVSALGKETPKAVVDEVLNHYRGNGEALNFVKQIGEKSGLYITIDNHYIDKELLSYAIAEAEKDFENATPLGALGCCVFSLEKMEGTATDSSQAMPVSFGLF